MKTYFVIKQVGIFFGLLLIFSVIPMGFSEEYNSENSIGFTIQDPSKHRFNLDGWIYQVYFDKMYPVNFKGKIIENGTNSFIRDSQFTISTDTFPVIFSEPFNFNNIQSFHHEGIIDDRGPSTLIFNNTQIIINAQPVLIDSSSKNLPVIISMKGTIITWATPPGVLTEYIHDFYLVGKLK